MIWLARDEMVIGGCLALVLGCGPGGSDDGGDTESDTVYDGDWSGNTDPSGPQDDDGEGDGSGTSGGGSMDESGGSSAGTTDGPGCTLPPVDDEVLGQLYIDNGLSTFVAAGASANLRLAWIDAGFPTEVEACVAWSVEGEGVTIDGGGVVTVDAATPAGSTFTVTADIEAGRRILTADFEVYVPIDAPILGCWTEVSQLPCGGGEPFTPDPIIGELVFRDTGEFSVTWTPFEIYIDYSGTFTYDEATGALTLDVQGGNYVPPDIDGEGTATVTDDQLTLADMWLGVAQDPVTAPACGHVFE